MAESCTMDTSDREQPTAKLTSSPSFVETPSGRKLSYEQQDGSSPGVVFIHGLCSDMRSMKATQLAEYCKEKDISYLRFDLSGHGSSSGNFKECNISDWLEDLEYIVEILTHGPQVIVGDALGGWLMFLYTMRNPDRIFGLVGIATAADFTQRLWKGLDKSTRDEVKRIGYYPFPSPVSDEPVVLTLDMIVDGEKHSILDMPGIELVKAPTWLLHGDQDTFVPPSISIQLMQRLQCQVELKMIEGGDHQLSRLEEIQVLLLAVDSLLTSKSDEFTSSGEHDDDIEEDRVEKTE